MARNRKYQATMGRYKPALQAAVICLLIGGSGVGYVWQKSQIIDLGRQINKREIRLANLREQNEKMRQQLATLRSPRWLEQRIKELNLGLVPPQPSQIVRLTEPSPASPHPGRNQEVAKP